MNSDQKVCPKCSAAMYRTFEVFLPAKESPGYSPNPIEFSTTQGITVQPYHCRSCGYIELYG